MTHSKATPVTYRNRTWKAYDGYVVQTEDNEDRWNASVIWTDDAESFLAQIRAEIDGSQIVASPVGSSKLPNITASWDAHYLSDGVRTSSGTFLNARDIDCFSRAIATLEARLGAA